MATKKTTIKATTPKEKSDAYKAMEQMIADYKAQSPEKYEAKKEELEAKLATL